MRRGWFGVPALLVAAWVGMAGVAAAAVADTGAVRRVWVWSDAHVGFNDAASGNRDGAAWLETAATDIRQHAGPVAWMLSLGDICHSSEREQFETFDAIRRRVGFDPWFAIAGNHDYAASKTNLWPEFVGRPRRFVLADGNGVWICFGVERGGAGGKISEPTLHWLRSAIASNQNRNVIVCSHQALAHTVARSNRDKNALYCPADDDPEPENEPNDPEHKREATDAALKRVEQVVADLRVDLWLCGHIHSSPRQPEAVARRGRTTFINVASISHAYNTGSSYSFVFEFREGSRTVNARCRAHDKGQFDPAFSTVVEFPYPWHFAGPPQVQSKRAVE